MHVFEHPVIVAKADFNIVDLIDDFVNLYQISSLSVTEEGSVANQRLQAVLHKVNQKYFELV